jgi:hypothetical protein
MRAWYVQGAERGKPKGSLFDEQSHDVIENTGAGFPKMPEFRPERTGDKLTSKPLLGANVNRRIAGRRAKSLQPVSTATELR